MFICCKISIIHIVNVIDECSENNFDVVVEQFTNVQSSSSSFSLKTCFICKGIAWTSTTHSAVFNCRAWSVCWWWRIWGKWWWGWWWWISTIFRYHLITILQFILQVSFHQFVKMCNLCINSCVNKVNSSQKTCYLITILEVQHILLMKK